MVNLDNKGYQVDPVLLGSQEMQGLPVIEVNRDHQVFQVLENQEKMV